MQNIGRFGLAALFWVSLALTYQAFLTKTAENARNPLWFHDDARITVPAFYRYSDAASWEKDYLGDYVLNFISYPIYKTIFRTGARLWDAERLSKALPCVFLVVTAAALAHAANVIAGPGAAWAAAALVFGSSAYMDRMAGGTPRAFAFPILALALAALAGGRVRWLRWLVWIAAGTYPMAGIPIGIALVCVLFFLPAADRGSASAWPMRQRAVYVGVTALVALGFIAPVLLSSAQYGQVIRDRDIPAYPEAGPEGTHGQDDRPPFPWYFEGAPRVFKDAIVGSGDPLVPSMRPKSEAELKTALTAIFSIALLGWVLLARHHGGARRASTLLAGSVAAQSLSLLMVPYLYHPERYIRFTVPPLATLFVVAGAAGFSHLFGTNGSRARNAVSMLGAAAVLALFASRGDPNVGYVFKYSEDEVSIYRAIEKLPSNVLLAGWPDDPMSSAPYLGRRKCLMTGEMHIAVHTGYLEEIRRRLKPLFAAYLATSPAPIARLRDEFGVTHIMLEHWRLSGSPPGYMSPFGAEIRKLDAERQGRPYELSRQLKNLAIYDDGRYALLDLSKLSTSTTTPPSTR